MHGQSKKRSASVSTRRVAGLQGPPLVLDDVNVGSVPISCYGIHLKKKAVNTWQTLGEQKGNTKGTLGEQKGNRKGTEREQKGRSVDNCPAHRGQAPDGRPSVRQFPTSPRISSKVSFERQEREEEGA